MILMKYSKVDGAEYLSHLDVLRHIGRTLSRAKIKIEYSKGYHPHMLVYLSAPIGVGMKSLSEYCLIETDCPLEGFKEKFNENSPRGLKCLDAFYTEKKVGVASDISKAVYFITGLRPFDVQEVLGRDEFIIINKEGKEKNVRHLIYSMAFEDGGLRCTLGFSNGLRAEKFAANLARDFGGEDIDIVKEEALMESGLPLESALR